MKTRQYSVLVEADSVQDNNSNDSVNLTQSSYTWVKFDGEDIPANALTKINSDGHTIAVCYGEIKGYGIHPGYMMVDTTKKCSIGYGGNEYELDDFYLLTGDRNKFVWIKWDSSKVLSGYQFIQGGYELNNPLYICKVIHDEDDEDDDHDIEYFGKYSYVSGYAYYSYHGKEYIKTTQYSILVEADSDMGSPDQLEARSSYTWVKFTGEDIPSNAITLENSDGTTVTVCYGQFENRGLHPGYMKDTTKKCHINYGANEYKLDDFYILIGDKNKLGWIEWNDSKSFNGYHFIQGGYESGLPLYVCRVTSNNMYYFGKTSSSLKLAFYSCNGKSFKQNQYYILVELDSDNNILTTPTTTTTTTTTTTSITTTATTTTATTTTATTTTATTTTPTTITPTTITTTTTTTTPTTITTTITIANITVPTTTIPETTTTTTTTTTISTFSIPLSESVWIYNSYYNKCLYAPTEIDKKITYGDCDDSGYDQWVIPDTLNGYFRSKANTNMCLRIKDIKSGKVLFGKCDKKATFHITTYHSFQSKYSNELCIGMKSDTEPYIHMNTCNEQCSDQQWEIKNTNPWML